MARVTTCAGLGLGWASEMKKGQQGGAGQSSGQCGGPIGCSQSARKSLCLGQRGHAMCSVVVTQCAPLSSRERERPRSLLFKLPDEATLTRHCNQTAFSQYTSQGLFTWVRKPLERCPSASTKTVGQDMA